MKKIQLNVESAFWRRILKNKFTLIELLAVIAVISVLVSILLPSLQGARVKVKMSICLSNTNQIGKANSLFLKNNNYKFISKIELPSRWAPGHMYVGTGTAQTQFKRPLNIYLDGPSTWTDEVMPVAKCPLAGEHEDLRFGDRFGTSYMGAARGEHDDDLDGDGWNPFNLMEINQPAKMIFLASTGAWHYARASVDDMWKVDNHGDRKYTLNFIDGSSKIQKISPTEGLTGSTDRIQFRNF